MAARLLAALALLCGLLAAARADEDWLLAAACLAEVGYFQAPLAQADPARVREALRLFQQDLQLPPSGTPDAALWRKLHSVRLSPARQAELAAARNAGKPPPAPDEAPAAAPAGWPRDSLVRIIHTQHYRRPPREAVAAAAQDPASLNRYLRELDPYSRLLGPDEHAYHTRRQAREQIGLGLNILVDGQDLLAVPLREGPAWRAGLRRPAYLLSIAGRALDPGDFASFRFLAELSAGTRLPLRVAATPGGADSRAYTLSAGAFRKPPLDYLEDGALPLVRIYAFDSGLGRELKPILEGLRRRGLPVVLDLRYCPGGSLFEAVDAASLFVPAEREVAYLRRADSDATRTLVSLPGRIAGEQPVSVWVGPFTASAAEIFARILQYHAGANVIGAPTQGKCLSQRHFEFADGSALQLSVFEILGPDRQPCQGRGVPLDHPIGSASFLQDSAYLARTLSDRGARQ